MRPEWFAGRLRQLRAAAGLTQQELAGRAGGMSVRAVTHLEAGDRLPSWETVLALCRALGCQPGDFASDPGPAPPRGKGRPRKGES